MGRKPGQIAIVGGKSHTQYARFKGNIRIEAPNIKYFFIRHALNFCDRNNNTKKV